MLYDEIKKIAKLKNISIYRIERDCKISNGTICKWNDSKPQSDNLYKVSIYLGTPIEELLSHDN